MFRITQTNDKLQNELDEGRQVGEDAASGTHYTIGKKVRETIQDIGGVMPEDLPPESERVQELERKLQAQRIDEKKLKEIE